MRSVSVDKTVLGTGNSRCLTLSRVIPVVQWYMPDVPLVASYHTNLASYATLFGFPWLTPTMWNLMVSGGLARLALVSITDGLYILQRNLHARCEFTACPSPSTARMLESQGFEHVRQWPRGVYTSLFNPEARDLTLRQAWGAEPDSTSPDSDSSTSATVQVDDSVPPKSSDKVVMLYVGRISWEKNLRLLVEAFRGLQEPSADRLRPACKLVFVGDGPARGELEQLCSNYRLDAVFMGYRKGSELAACFASADIFAFPSWWVWTETVKSG